MFFTVKAGMYICILIIGYLSFAVADCTFPENVTGLWHSADRGEITFNATSIFGFNVGVPGLTTMDFNCIDQSGSTYLLQGVEFINIFGKITRFFLCLEMTKVNDDVFYYYVGTEFDNFLNDYLFGRIDEIATITQACNRPTPYETATYIMLIRDGSIENKTAVIVCPDPILAVFENVTISHGGSSQSCASSTLDVCSDRTQMNFTLKDPACVAPLSPYSSADQFTCVHYLKVENTIYLSAWNLDSAITEPTTYQFVCFALQQIGDVVYATETPNFCTNTTTETSPGTNRAGTVGNSMTFTSTSATCLTVLNVTTEAPVVQDLTPLYALLALPLWLLLSLLILLAIILFRKFGCICMKIKCPKRKPKPRPETPDMDVSRGETNPKQAFSMRSDVYFKQNGMNISLFRPKKALKIFPMFDASWDPSALPFILPLPKVEPIYNDPLDIYMRDRLPRRKSALSLYSFDAVFVGNGNGTVTHK
ncbi:uncharacterized protein LOC110466711 [Mizuhopecten yessoensis]|uniref:DUF7042 domain-containing protein n=1 Tax=Mizuhopecten yessoensis TaxID=6573 RepID=A0A210PNN1_MIZYE|nr:uncharacterized protein LOC110466711 [Mizuhopecten yessoensis]OWF38054.1 hypothetical protein KP79_PYT12807 [Mizuhopecten yessoensis]